MAETQHYKASLPAQEESEQSCCDQSITGGSLLTLQPLHLGVGEHSVRLEQSVATSTSIGGMNGRKKRGSESDLTADTADPIDLFDAATDENPTADAQTPNQPPPSNKKYKRRVSFCNTTKPPSTDQLETVESPCPFINSLQKLGLPTNNNDNSITMKKSTSCTALPQLAASSTLLISEACTTGELDLSVSPSAFVQTIVLQSKSITGSIRGEDVISDASARVKRDSYFLTYTDEHLEAYTTDKVNAVQANDVATLRSLHDAGHVMQASNRFGESMLHTSCRRGFTDVVEFFVKEAGVCPRVRDDMGRTPMHDACWSLAAPNHDIVRMLIRAAPELLLSRDKRGHSPFDYARREYWPNWVAFLNEHRQFIVNSLVASCMESSEGLEEGIGGLEEGGLLLGRADGSVANQ